MMNTMLKPALERSFDMCVAIMAILVFVVPMLIVALLIRVFIGSPILFRQQRPGLQGKLFTLYKFRTMNNVFDKEGQPLPDGHRLTKLGYWLRRTSLDELPQLFNVLKGDLRLVGPRPLLVEYLSLYTSEQARRHEVKPGITGWAQINGRNAISWEEKFKLDIWYVEHQSFWLDLKILWLTGCKIFQTKDINQPGHVTTDKFTGSE